jgi:hypothetical protein
MGYCFICGDQCDGATVKTIAGIKIEMATKAGWLPSRIPRRLAGPNPRNWWQDTVHQSISSNWSLCSPCAAEFEGASSRKETPPPAPEAAPARPAVSVPSAEKPAEAPSSKPASDGAKIATPVDATHKPAPAKAPDSPALRTLKRNQLIALSPGSLGIMIAIVMFSTAEKGVPFSFLLVPISLIALAVLGVLVLEGRKVQLGKAALEDSLWGEFFQATFQAWRGGLLDELAAWYRTAPTGYDGLQGFISQNIEIRAFRKLGHWFRPEPDEFLVEVESQTRGKPSFLLTNRRAIVTSTDGLVSFAWTSVKKISFSRHAQGMEINLVGGEGKQSLVVAHAPSEKAMEFLVRKQGVPLSGVRAAPTTQEAEVRTMQSVVAGAATASNADLEWLATQGAEAFALILGVSDRVRSGEWSMGEGLGRLCATLGEMGTEDARKLLTTLLQLPDPTREAELVREGAARALDKLRSRS